MNRSLLRATSVLAVASSLALAAPHFAFSKMGSSPMRSGDAYSLVADARYRLVIHMENGPQAELTYHTTDAAALFAFYDHALKASGWQDAGMAMGGKMPGGAMGGGNTMTGGNAMAGNKMAGGNAMTGGTTMSGGKAMAGDQMGNGSAMAGDKMSSGSSMAGGQAMAGDKMGSTSGDKMGGSTTGGSMGSTGMGDQMGASGAMAKPLGQADAMGAMAGMRAADGTYRGEYVWNAWRLSLWAGVSGNLTTVRFKLH